MSLTSLVIGLVFLGAGLYQFVDQRLGGLRVAGVIGDGLDDDDVSPQERFFSKVVGVGLVVLGLFFLWLGQY